MGFIVDDNEKGIHGEARSDTFLIFSDFAHDWCVELEWDLIPELKLIIERLEAQHAKEARPSPASPP